MSGRILFGIMAFASAAVLAGCANQNAVYRTHTVGENRPLVITMDAKQRNLLMLPEAVVASKPAMGTSEVASVGWRVCAEASPDAFSALSTSAGAELGFSQSGAQTEAKAKAAIAIAEAAGTIERTQTVNLLRESMYRTCERYLSGAIDKSTFVVQAGRDWRAMIAVLAIEQLTRTARPPSTVLVAGSTAASVSDSSGIVKEFVAAKAEQRAAEDAAAKLAGDLAVDCTKVDADKKDACEAAKSAATAAKPASDLRISRAKEDVDDYRSALKTAAIDGSQAATGGGVSQPGGGGGVPGPSDLAVVAGAVERIANKALDTNELQLFCIQKLADARSDPGGVLEHQCLSLLSVSVGAKADAISEDLASFNASLAKQEATLSDFLVDDAGAALRWPLLIRNSGLPTNDPLLAKRLLVAPITKASALAAFRNLVPDDYRSTIVKLTGGVQ